jgi:hypothetical protein
MSDYPFGIRCDGPFVCIPNLKSVMSRSPLVIVWFSQDSIPTLSMPYVARPRPRVVLRDAKGFTYEWGAEDYNREADTLISPSEVDLRSERRHLQCEDFISTVRKAFMEAGQWRRG